MVHKYITYIIQVSYISSQSTKLQIKEQISLKQVNNEGFS